MRIESPLLVIISIIFIFLFIFNFQSYAQTPKEQFVFLKEDLEQETKLLKAEFCSNKHIPIDFESACVLALSYYPELKGEKIHFIYGKGAYSMAARPAPLSLFGRRKNREYRVFINTASRNKGLLLSELSFNAQVGVIGHELAHILDYTKKSSLRIILDGIGYASKKFRARFEKATDKEAIDRGLGWQVYDFCHKTHKAEKVPEIYKQYKLRIYMTPESIREYIQNQVQN